MVLKKEVRFKGETGSGVTKKRKQVNKGGKDSEMTKSAPPQRTNTSARNTSNYGSGSGRYTSTARALKSKSSADMFSISVEDIYQSAERERLNYSSECRRQNLAHAQSQTQFFRQGQSSPISRPNTSASRHIHALRRESNTPISAWSEPNVSRPNSIVPHPELRLLTEDNEEESVGDDDDFDMSHQTPLTVTFSPVNRGDCCEILGPQLCYECRKNRIRQVNRERSDMFFPTLEPSEENLTTAAIVRKYLPGLSEQEVEDKLARGEIARPSFRKQNKNPEFSDEEDDVKPKLTNKKVTIAETEKAKRAKELPTKPNQLFFTNIRDLNSKIISGNVDRNIGFSNAVRKVIKKEKDLSAKNYFPTFVSPRKVVMVQETNYKTYFDPPLIEKAKQDVEPAFFAGSSGEYTLPEKLPDELVFLDKDGNEVKASSSKGFTSKVPASSEKKGKSATGKQDRKMSEIDTELEILKEDEEAEENVEDDDDVHEFLSTGESEHIVHIDETSEKADRRNSENNDSENIENLQK